MKKILVKTDSKFKLQEVYQQYMEGDITSQPKLRGHSVQSSLIIIIILNLEYPPEEKAEGVAVF